MTMSKYDPTEVEGLVTGRLNMATAHQPARRTDLKIKSIAVLTDFSQNADTALRYAAVFARVHGANLVLAHAYLPPSCAYTAPDAAFVYQSFDDRREDLENRLLEETEGVYLRDIKCTALVRMGGPWDLLEDLRGVDLIVVGTSGKSGGAKAVLGSTAEAIFRASTIPVLTVGPRCRRSDAGETALGTVLYPTDLSAGAAIALPYAVSIANEHNAELVFLHVIEDKDVAFSFERAMASAEPLERLRKLIPDDADLKHKPKCLIDFGTPAGVILKEAIKDHAQLIVMGARGAGTLASIVCRFGGGTAYSVAANAHCPVLTIREE
jgi:nucleotide-binding universal stress UspA family protein